MHHNSHTHYSYILVYLTPLSLSVCLSLSLSISLTFILVLIMYLFIYLLRFEQFLPPPTSFFNYPHLSLPPSILLPDSLSLSNFFSIRSFCINISNLLPSFLSLPFLLFSFLHSLFCYFLPFTLSLTFLFLFLSHLFSLLSLRPPHPLSISRSPSISPLPLPPLSFSLCARPALSSLLH